MTMIALQIAKTIQKAMVNNGTKVVELLELTLFNIWFKFEQVTIIDHYARRSSQLNYKQLHILTDLQVILSEIVAMNCIGNDKLAV
ncbi:MAG: hypothetical protein Q7J20_04615 [Candidatus Nitrotoga sp.]|nr:hypothetical protein [Candidatus Nitrotoga sp.]MDO9447173.1 hypothetical protein [Candidatus Nitrotoga sp.]MDP3496601.1 hypothetical protein [Candidatus Nitrotoga sp.]